MTDRELMQMALDALEWCYDVTEWPANGNSPQDKAIEALRARLAQPEPELVACDCDSPAWCKQYKKCHRAMLGFEPYVAPPQREWQWLTDEEIEQIVDTHWNDPSMFIEAIEAKLKEKNT